MRVHRVALQAVGPYAELQELDFDRLTDSGLFLLSGPTGAGKTTILDAIVFGLYGTLPGARGGDGKRDKRARERIVSDLRDPNTQPRVELEVTIAGRRFRIVRVPDHARPKTRGEGLTMEKASASLSELVGGEWQARSTDFQEISVELGELLGMSADQFSQVVLLPQGEFAGFLRASVDDRRKVLERLFQVDRYESAEAWLRARAQQAELERRAAEGELQGALLRLLGAIDSDQPPLEAGIEGAALQDWIEGERIKKDVDVFGFRIGEVVSVPKHLDGI